MSDELIPSSGFFTDVCGILADARRAAYTAVNSAMVAAYWQIGRRIVEEDPKARPYYLQEAKSQGG